MKYGKLRDAIKFYNCSEANIIQRSKRGSLPFKSDGSVRQYALDDKYKVKGKGKPNPKPKSTKPKQPKKQPNEVTKEMVEFHGASEELEKKIIEYKARHTPFIDPVQVEQSLATRMVLTDTDRECIHMYCEHYKNYMVIYGLAMAEPLIDGIVNPLFRIAKDEWVKVNELSKQLGIGIRNRLALRVEAPQEANPFEVLLK